MSCYSSEERETAFRLISDLGLSPSISSYVDEATLSSSSGCTSPTFSPLNRQTSSYPDISSHIRKAVAVAKKSADLRCSKMAERIAQLEHELVMAKLKNVHTATPPPLPDSQEKKEISRLCQEVNELELALEQSRTKNQDLVNEMSNLKASTKTTQSISTELDRKSSEVSQLSTQVTSLKQNIIDLKAENSRLSVKVKQLSETLHSAELAGDAMSSEIKSKNQEISRLLDSINDLNKSVAEFRHNLDENIDQNSSLKQALHTCQEKLSQLTVIRSEYEDIKAELAEVKEFNNEISKENSELKDKINNSMPKFYLQKQLENSNMEVISLKKASQVPSFGIRKPQQLLSRIRKSKY
ncbi:hypothetical protein P9112_008819 [Eukaryota sp. TZLM1-RC]